MMLKWNYCKILVVQEPKESRKQCWSNYTWIFFYKKCLPEFACNIMCKESEVQHIYTPLSGSERVKKKAAAKQQQKTFQFLI